jgi:cytochrome P450
MEPNISREPLLCPVVRMPVRRATLRRFPYTLFHMVEPDLVVVLGCLHHRRDPKVWPDRTPDS